MIEIREDLISKKRVVINDMRAFRPHDIKTTSFENKKKCVFCPGNEKLTPPELDRDGDDTNWNIRVFNNKFPILTLTKEKNLSKGLNNAWKGHGNNEVIVLTQKHEEHPVNFNSKKWFQVLKMYRKRIEVNKKMKGVNYVLLFHNQGGKAGASIKHTHSQLLSFPLTPRVIKTESESCKAKFCCRMIKDELKKNRLVKKNKDFIVFSNYASRFPYETHLYPLKHFNSFTDLTDDLLYSLSEIFHSLMKAYNKLFNEFDFNFVIHDAPKKNKDYHFHIEFYPKFNKFAGVELGTGIVVNTVSPETAAKKLRSALR